MSDYNRINSAELDRHITGNYGEDQFRDDDPDEEEGGTEREMVEWLLDLLYHSEDEITVSTFEEMGLLTSNKGLVVTTEEGSEFQITIVRSR